MSREVLEKIALRAEAATAGPWAVDPGWAAPGWEPGYTYTRIVSGEPNKISGIRHPVLSTEGALQKGRRGLQNMDDAVFVSRAREDVPRLVTALTAVLDLHLRRNNSIMKPWCQGCGNNWPCPTAQVIETALEGAS